MGTMKHISLMQYADKMGTLRFPDGFEAHLKKFASEYAGYVSDLSDAEGPIRLHLQECRVANITRQLRCYGWSEFKRPVEWNDPRLVAEKPDPELQRMIQPIMAKRDNIRLIVKENMVVGVALEDAIGYLRSDDDYFYLTEDHYLFPYYGFVYSSTSDNNGAGYKERDWHRYLICLPYNHNLW